MTEHKQSQIDKFKQAAHELECDDDDLHFKDRLKKIAKAKPSREANPSASKSQ